MRNFFVFVFGVFFFILAANVTIHAQAEPVLQLCVEYGDDGEESISDVFTTGYLTVVVKSDTKLGLEDVHIQFDKYNFKKDKWEFYKKFDYTIQPSHKYVYFSRNDDSDMSFDETGFFRVYLLDDDDKVVASTIVKIIEKQLLIR